MAVIAEVLSEQDAKKGIDDLIRFVKKQVMVKYGKDISISYVVDGEGVLEPRVKPTDTIKHMCEVLGVQYSELVGVGRARKIVHARFMIAKLMHELYPSMPCTRIALVMGKDHSSVLYFYDRFKECMQLSDFADDYTRLKYLINKWLKNKMAYVDVVKY